MSKISQKLKLILVAIMLCFILTIFFRLLYVTDNKYTTPPPYGQDGIISLTQEDFSRDKPIYLIDGWLLSDRFETDRLTYIGEFSNLQRGNYTKRPHGEATYSLTLRYTGQPKFISIDFPELFTRYKISVNDNIISTGIGSARITFILNPGDTFLDVTTISHIGYYSGMYYPAALGTPEMILHVERIKTLIYSFAFCCTLVMSAYTLQLWRRREKDNFSFWLGLCCSFFAFFISYYFIHLIVPQISPLWYFMEEIALYGLILCMLQLSKITSGLRDDIYSRVAVIITILIPILLMLLHTLIPYWTFAVVLHGLLKNFYFILTFLMLLIASIICTKRKRSEYVYLIIGNLIFGIGLLLNILNSNLFEPIYSLWQFEWCGLILVWVFASMMVSRNRRILIENEQFTLHLESLVEQRTEELSHVLEERRAFFSDMAHDLKSPLLATKTFIDAIRAHSVGVDDELEYYLEQLGSKQTEMTRRVQSLNTLNSLDKIEGIKKKTSIRDLLEEVYVTHNAEAEVSAINFIIQPPNIDCFIFVQVEKLMMAFENLIYNAIRATPANGTITITAQNLEKIAHITVDDTGCGISEVELPYIFKRFYVGEKNKTTGSGLGLYIVKSVVEESGGHIEVTSQLGKGTRFTFELPTCL